MDRIVYCDAHPLLFLPWAQWAGGEACLRCSLVSRSQSKIRGTFMAKCEQRVIDFHIFNPVETTIVFELCAY